MFIIGELMEWNFQWFQYYQGSTMRNKAGSESQTWNAKELQPKKRRKSFCNKCPTVLKDFQWRQDSNSWSRLHFFFSGHRACSRFFCSGRSCWPEQRRNLESQAPLRLGLPSGHWYTNSLVTSSTSCTFKNPWPIITVVAHRRGAFIRLKPNSFVRPTGEINGVTLLKWWFQLDPILRFEPMPLSAPIKYF